MQVRDDVNDFTRTYDPKGRIINTVERGHNRDFYYDQAGNLSGVRFSGGDVINVDAHGKWTQSWRDRNNQIVSRDFHFGHAVADQDGTLRLMDGTGILKDERMVVFKPDGERVIYNQGRATYAADLSKESLDLNVRAAQAFTDASHLARFSKLRSDFEAAAIERGITPEKQALFYKQVNRLLEPAPGAPLKQSERALLAEQLMAHAARPQSVDQGCFGTCNVTTLEVRNYSRDPAANAQIIADIATTGKFTTTNGFEIDMTKVQGGIKPDLHSMESLKLQVQGTDLIKIDGSRDWVSQLNELAMINSYWQARPTMVANGQRVSGWDLAYDRNGAIIGRQNDRTVPLPKLYDDKGKPIESYQTGMKLYDRKGNELNNINHDDIVFDLARKPIGLLDESKITTFTDASGRRISRDQVGANGFDKRGEHFFSNIPPGSGRFKYEVAGDKYAKERLMYDDGSGFKIFRDARGKQMHNPGIATTELAYVNRLAGDIPERNYVFRADTTPGSWGAYTNITSVEDFGTRLSELKANGQLPAVLQVHSANPPFDSRFGTQAAFGSGSWHVVNIHDYDPIKGTVKFSNQWGSHNDFLSDEGYPIDKLYKAMSESRLHKFMASDRGKNALLAGKIVGGLAAAGAAAGLGYGGAYFFLRDDR